MKETWQWFKFNSTENRKHLAKALDWSSIWELMSERNLLHAKTVEKHFSILDTSGNMRLFILVWNPSVCSKTVSHSIYLTQHKRSHTGERPYKCKEYGKAFSQRIHLSIHQRVHTGVKPYECSHCGKGFRHDSSFAKHQRIHTGEKPYDCNECGKAFSCSLSLIWHCKTHLRNTFSNDVWNMFNIKESPSWSKSL